MKYSVLFGDGASIAAVAVDSNGNAYIAGTAGSPLPVTPGAFRTQYNPASCTLQDGRVTVACPIAFAAKLSADGTTLLYLTYLGMSQSSAFGISVDAQGNAWIAGAGSSDLPVTPGALQATPGGSFIVKLNPSGSQALVATYFNGDVTSQALDANGNLYLAGYAVSPGLPVTAGAFQTDPGQSLRPQVPFVSKLDSTGKLVYATYFHGGSGSTTNIASIAADTAGNAYVTGGESGGSLPVTAGAFQTTASGYSGFAAKLDPTGSKLIYCTYLTANTPIFGSAIAVDSQNNAYVAGTVAPDVDQILSNFPVTPGAFQAAPPSFPVQELMRFGFLAKLNAAGSGLVYATFLAASDFVTPTGLTVDGAGSAIVLGSTYAYDFPTTPGALHQCYPSANLEAGFLLKISADGSQPLYSTYLGAEEPTSVAVDNSGEIYVAGNYAGALPIVPGSFGWTDDSDGAFAVKIAPEPFAAGSVSCVVSAANRGGSAIAPGEIVDIFGIGIGPAQSVSASAVSGQIPTSLGGVQVFIAGYPAPLLSAGPNQIRAVVPFELAAPALLDQNQFTAEIQILSAAAPAQPFTATVAAASPAIYTVGGNTPGRALMINQDGTLNSEQNPAPQGSVVTIYATGLNNTQPPLATGVIATEAVPLAFEAQLQIGSATGGQLTYAGTAPGFVAGLTQINFLIPVSLLHGFSTVHIFLPNGVGSEPVYFYQQ